MGRTPYSNRCTVEQCLCLGIDDLRRIGVLQVTSGSYRSLQWTDSVKQKIAEIGCTVESIESTCLSLRLFYTVKSPAGQKKDVDYRIDLTTTPCNYGGFRHWFICPLVKHGLACGRRVGKLYLPPNGFYFGCRHCYDLTYRSCRERDSRVSALLKLPTEHLAGMLESKNPRQALLGVRAYFKLLDRLEKDRKN